MPDGRILVTLKAEWRDGTTHLVFEPVELLEKLAALTPRPRINLVLYHGVLAPHARWRGRAVAYGRAEGPPGEPAPDTPSRTGPGRRYWAWADLMRRAFETDVLACPRCGGPMQLIATIDDPAVIRKILTHLGIPADVPIPRPPDSARERSRLLTTQSPPAGRDGGSRSVDPGARRAPLAAIAPGRFPLSTPLSAA
jgi:hypothetical protein